MTALDRTAMADYADRRHAEARQTLDTHVTSAYTGLCLACGRPGPCEARQAAERTAAHYTRRDLPLQRPATPAAQATTAA
ncbi:hypothetical protein ACFQ0D_02555, partial [Micromonospora zhanjiangensis]